jgi:Zn-dependent protease with chaperone function
MPSARAPALVLIVALTTACATGGASLAGPTVAEETTLRAQADAETQLLLAQVEIDDDPLVADYLASIIDRLATDAERDVNASGVTVTVTVVRDPTIAAFALPNGRIFIHTGLLSRVANEAQLATVLARARAHLARHHATGRAGADAQVGAAILGLAGSIGAALETPGALGDERGGRVLSPTARAILGKRLVVAHVAAVTGHGGALEREADMGALERLVKAAYDPKEAPRAFERLRRDARAGGIVERFSLGNDAVLAERGESAAGLVATTFAVAASVPDTIRDTEDFTAVMAVVVRENAALELRGGRFRFALEQLDRVLGVQPTDPLAHLYYGELYRLRSQRARSVADRDELVRRALASYERSAALDPNLAEVHRQLGLLYYQQRQPDRAREAFARYIALSPDAPDVARIREYLVALAARP